MSMNKILAFAVFMFCAVTLQAQEIKIDKELASLVEVVKMLRVPSQANFSKARQLLKADGKWTPMNETGKLQITECKPSEKTPSFRLNRLLTSIANEKKRVSTTGSMLNGEDSRYNYSLYERSLKKGKSATYKLRNRSGKQTLVLVPFVKKKGSLSILVDGNKPTIMEDQDGTVVCTFNSTGKEISLSVTNKSGAALSFVLLNHNSRKK